MNATVTLVNKDKDQHLQSAERREAKQTRACFVTVMLGNMGPMAENDCIRCFAVGELEVENSDGLEGFRSNYQCVRSMCTEYALLLCLHCAYAP
jgi:hypothetical protein